MRIISLALFLGLLVGIAAVPSARSASAQPRPPASPSDDQVCMVDYSCVFFFNQDEKEVTFRVDGAGDCSAVRGKTCEVAVPEGTYSVHAFFRGYSLQATAHVQGGMMDLGADECDVEEGSFRCKY